MSAIQPRSLEELHRYTEELSSRNVEENRVVRNLQAAQRITWLLLLVLAFLFFYLIDRLQEALAILR